VKAQAYSTEAVNPRHEHEWEVWQHVELPEEKVLIPDAIDSVNIPIEPRSWYFVTRDLVGERSDLGASASGGSRPPQHLGGTHAAWDPTAAWASPHPLPQERECLPAHHMTCHEALATRQLW